MSNETSPDYRAYVERNQTAQLLRTPSLKSWSQSIPEQARYYTHHPMKRQQKPRNVLKKFEGEMPTKYRNQIKKFLGEQVDTEQTLPKGSPKVGKSSFSEEEVKQTLRLNNQLLQSDAVQVRLREIERQIPQGFPNRQAIIDQLLNQFLQNEFTSSTVKPNNSEELNRLLSLYRGKSTRSRKTLGRSVLERIVELLNVRSGDVNVDDLINRIDKKLSGEQITTRTNPPLPPRLSRRARSEVPRETQVQPQERTRPSRDDIDFTGFRPVT